MFIQQKQMIFNPEPFESTKDGAGRQNMSTSGMPEDDGEIDNPDKSSVEFIPDIDNE